MENTSAVWNAEYRDEQAIPSSTRAAPSKALTMLEAALPDEADHVVELGCGNGRNLPWLAAQYPDATIIGVDFAEQAVERARETVEQADVDVTVVEADVFDWLADQSAASIDVVVDSYFSQHLIDAELREEYVDELGRTVAAGGAVYWSALGVADEYYRDEARSVGERVIEDPANGVQKRLYGGDEAWDVFGSQFEASLVTTVQFSDTVEGASYRRSIQAGCFDRV